MALWKRLCMLQFLVEGHSSFFSKDQTTGQSDPSEECVFLAPARRGYPRNAEMSTGHVFVTSHNAQGTRRPGGGAQEVQGSLWPAHPSHRSLPLPSETRCYVTLWHWDYRAIVSETEQSFETSYHYPFYIFLEILSLFLLKILRRLDPNHKAKLPCRITVTWTSWSHYTYGLIRNI